MAIEKPSSPRTAPRLSHSKTTTAGIAETIVARERKAQASHTPATHPRAGPAKLPHQEREGQADGHVRDEPGGADSGRRPQHAAQAERQADEDPHGPRAAQPPERCDEDRDGEPSRDLPKPAGVHRLAPQGDERHEHHRGQRLKRRVGLSIVMNQVVIVRRNPGQMHAPGEKGLRHVDMVVVESVRTRRHHDVDSQDKGEDRQPLPYRGRRMPTPKPAGVHLSSGGVDRMWSHRTRDRTRPCLSVNPKPGCSHRSGVPL